MSGRRWPKRTALPGPMRTGRGARGQGLVEFSLVVIPFLWMLMGITDLGRGIYMNTGVGQAARELARATSVHPCDPSATVCTLGTAPQTAATLDRQEALVPGLGEPGSSVTYACTTINDEVLSSVNCPSGAFVRVEVTVPFQVITPLLSMVGPSVLSSTSHVQIP